MADQGEGPDPAIEAEAKALGWVPKGDYRGDESRWVTAEEFVERGHQVMPLLRKNNETLVSKLTKAQTELATLTVKQATTEQTVKDLLTFQAAEVKRQVEAQVTLLKSQLREARKGDDPDLVSDLEDALDEAKDKVKVASAPPPPAPLPPPPAPPSLEPWAIEFQAANADWFEKDRKKTAVFMVEADELFRTTPLRGADLMAKAKANMELTFSPGPPADKGEGGSRGAGGGGGGGGAKGYDSLPADAKAVCSSQAKTFVGEGKAFKTLKDWQTHYVTTYNASA